MKSVENKKTHNKIKVIFVYTEFGIGGIAKSLIDVFRILDYSKYEVTLYIRRDDVLDLIDSVPPQVNIITIKNAVKNKEFENNLLGKTVKIIYNFLNKNHKHLAKKLFVFYKTPIQRKNEYKELEKNHQEWDIAISYSTDNDDPIFVKNCVKAKTKYIFIHQSTDIAKSNISAMNHFDSVISVNPALVPWIENMVKSSTKIKTIENFVDNKSINKCANEITVPHKKFTIATCGRLCITKGYDYVIETANNLKKDGIDFVWYWIGDGPSRNDMEHMIKKHGLEEQIKITSFLNNPYPYIKVCDLYIQPSRAEAYPLSILETLALCKPIISTKTKGGQFILNKYKCGFLVNESSTEISQKIKSFIENPDLLIKETKLLETIDWEKERNRYIKQWNELLNPTINEK